MAHDGTCDEKEAKAAECEGDVTHLVMSRIESRFALIKTNACQMDGTAHIDGEGYD